MIDFAKYDEMVLAANAVSVPGCFFGRGQATVTPFS
jgi:hypothetical protein